VTTRERLPTLVSIINCECLDLLIYSSCFVFANNTLLYSTLHHYFSNDTELKLMEIDGEQLGIPDTPYKSTIKMPAEEFQRIVRDLQVLGDTCTIACTKEGIRFSVSGNIGTGNILTRANATADDDKNHVIIDMEEPVELNFALRYLAFFTKATPLSGSVIISMSPDVPVVIEYPIGEVGHIKFYLAPKIEEDGDGAQE
jgi:proliferating cell nuclear antigen